MLVVGTIQELRDALRPARFHEKRIGLVPTMGAFHDGHLHLMRTAKEECDVVVVSLFVNPAQFSDPADLAAYPRNDVRDRLLAESAGVDVLFMPSQAEVYPPGFNSFVNVEGATQPLEGATRGAGHFRGVATVITKLFNLVQPHAAFFGQKDAQQTVVINQLVRDLNFPVEIVVCPTVREADGLALSSRNTRLSPEARVQAAALSQALKLIEQLVAQGEGNTAPLLSAARAHLNACGLNEGDIEYFAAVDPTSLRDQPIVSAQTLFVVAARVGGVRLIDNVIVSAAERPAAQ